MEDKLVKSLAQRESRIQHKQQMDRLTSLEKTVVSTMAQLVKFLNGKTTKTEVINQLKSVSTPDIDKVVEALNKLDSNIAENKLDISPLEKCLENIEQKLDKLPTEYPEMPEGVEEVTVKNQIDLKPLEKAIKAIKLDPTIEYKAGDVKVDAPDLKPLQDSMIEVIKAFKAQKYPETDLTNVEKKLETSNKLLKELTEKKFGGGGGGGGNGTPYVDSTGKPVNVELNPDGTIPTSASATLTPRFDTSVANTVYIGKAPIGSSESDSVWQLVKFDYSSTSNMYGKYADGGAFTAKWSDHLTETYA